MNILWGIVLILFTLILCWLAQVINAVAPALAGRLGLSEPAADVDPVFYVDTRAEAIWDALVLWPLPVAGLLLLFDSPHWPYFGLVGGGMFLYFAGRGLIVRHLMGQKDIRVGKPETLKLYNAILLLWGLIAIVTIIMATDALPVP